MSGARPNESSSMYRLAAKANHVEKKLCDSQGSTDSRNPSRRAVETARAVAVGREDSIHRVRAVNHGMAGGT